MVGRPGNRADVGSGNRCEDGRGSQVMWNGRSKARKGQMQSGNETAWGTGNMAGEEGKRYEL